MERKRERYEEKGWEKGGASMIKFEGNHSLVDQIWLGRVWHEWKCRMKMNSSASRQCWQCETYAAKPFVNIQVNG